MVRMKNIAALFFLSLMACKSPAQVSNDLSAADADKQFSRVMRHKDGTTSHFLRTPSDEILEKKTYQAGSSHHCMRTVYRMDRKGNPLGCQIYDGLNTMLFKSRYGYDRETGRLVEEQMFDARVKRFTADGKNEMPVRRFIYTYDANGKMNKPIAIVLRPGRRADEVYAQPSGLTEDMYKDEPSKQSEPSEPIK